MALPALAVVAIAGAAMSASSKAMESRERARSAQYDALNRRNEATFLEADAEGYDRQAKELKLASAQTEARRREALTSSLETIQAIRAGRGVGMGSPTGLAILSATSMDEDRDTRIEELNYLSKAEQARLAANRARFGSKSSSFSSHLAKKGAKTSLVAGYLDAGGSAASSISSISGARTGGK